MAFGTDKISLGDNAATSGEYEHLIFDAGNPDKQKLALNLTINFESLATGESVTPKYKLDRASSFTSGTAASTVGDTRAEEPIYQRFNEVEIGFTLASSSNTYPKVISIEFSYDDLVEERTSE